MLYLTLFFHVLNTELYTTFTLFTLAKTEIIYPKNVRAKVAMDFT